MSVREMHVGGCVKCGRYEECEEEGCVCVCWWTLP